MAVNPTFLRYGYSAATDMPALAFESLALMVLVNTCATSREPPAAAQSPARNARGSGVPLVLLLAGVLAALAALTRYSAVLLLPAGLAALLIRPPAAVSRVRAAMMFTLGFALPVLPWIVYSHEHGVFPGESLLRYFSFYAGSQETNRSIQDLSPHSPDSMHAYRSLSNMMHEDTPGLVMRSLRNIPRHLAQDADELLGWPTAVLALVGLAILPFSGAGGGLVAVWAAGLALMLLFSPVFYSHRYVMPVIPIELSLAALALAGPSPRADSVEDAAPPRPPVARPRDRAFRSGGRGARWRFRSASSCSRSVRAPASSSSSRCAACCRPKCSRLAARSPPPRTRARAS